MKWELYPVSDFDLFKKYQEIHQFREEVTGKKSRKDSNTFMDCVVAFHWINGSF